MIPELTLFDEGKGRQKKMFTIKNIFRGYFNFVQV